MGSLNTALDVARWEFWRYFKPRQQVIGLIVMAVAGAATFAVVRLNERSSDDTVSVSVVAAPGVALPEVSGAIELSTATTADVPVLRDAVADGDIDGLLLLEANGAGELLVRRRAGWVDQLHTALTEMRRSAVLERENIAAETLADALAPADLDVVIHEAARDTSSNSSRFGFIVIVSLMLMSIFTGMGYIFASITGEKQIRVTEQVMSAIPAQSWIDGKILGLTAVSLASVLSTTAGLVLLFAVLRLAGVGVPVPTSLGDPLMVAVIILFAMLGLLLWLSFLAAIAAMIDDPHTSTRGSMLMVPIMASALAFLALGNPDGGLVRTLSLLPPTAPTVMPARMLLTDVSPFETLAALALLIIAVLALRIAAGRVFRTAMLMYGKEPTWAEVRRWVVQR